MREETETAPAARIAPVPRDEWPPAMHDAQVAFRQFAPPRPPRQPSEGRPQASNALGTFACYPELAKAYFTFNGHILYGSSLSARQREMLILRVAALRTADYEWAQHVILGAAAGLSDDEIERIAAGPEHPDWSGPDRSLLQAVDDLIATARVSDATWADLAGGLDEHQLIDLVFTVGAYETLAMAFRSFGVEPDADLIPHLPSSTGVWARNAQHQPEGT